MTKKSASVQTSTPTQTPAPVPMRKRSVVQHHTNVPFQVKLYQLTPINVAGLAKAPKQVRALIAAAKGEPPMRGEDLANLAVRKGYLQTKSDPWVIFCYYRKTLETFGLACVSHRHARAKAPVRTITAEDLGLSA